MRWPPPWTGILPSIRESRLWYCTFQEISSECFSERRLNAEVMVQLQIHQIRRLLNALRMGACRLDQAVTMPQQGTLCTDLLCCRSIGLWSLSERQSRLRTGMGGSRFAEFTKS